MDFGQIIKEDCFIKEAAPTPSDPRCSDPAFALANPGVCGNTSTLILKPGDAICCLLGSIQIKAVLLQNGVETDVTSSCVFTTSDSDIAVVGVSSGNATGLDAGDVVITASYQTLIATCNLTVIGELNSCQECFGQNQVALMVLVDDSKSMSQPFNTVYPTKLVYAKTAAAQLIASVNPLKDLAGLMSFDDSQSPVLAAPSSNIVATGALVSGISQTQQLTGFNAALKSSIAQLAASGAQEQVIVLITDGEDTSASDLTDANDSITTLNNFKSTGGIVICLGVRATGSQFLLLEAFATGGFFINAYNATAAASLQLLVGLKSYIGAGNCTPKGDNFQSVGALDYCGFKNWTVVGGHVDLIGNNFLDFIPGNGLYVDMAGSNTPHGGALISKKTFALVGGKNYRLSLNLAGNQRVAGSSNTVQLAVFSRNSDGLANPVSAPVLVNDSSGTPITPPLPTFKYVYTYVNANGETAPSPVANVIPHFSGGFVTVQTAANPSATAIRIYRTIGVTPDSPYYMIAQIANTAPLYSDFMDLNDMVAALVAGTVDPCGIAPTYNSTGTPVYYLNQTVTLNNYQQGFTPQSFNFTMAANATVWVSMQQTAFPANANAAGLLLDSVSFDNTTDIVNLLSDNFDTENQQYIPPACGVGTTYIVSYGGTSSMPSQALIPMMTSNTTPSGIASASSWHSDEIELEEFFPWRAFTGQPIDVELNYDFWESNTNPSSWLQYQFPAPVTVASYQFFGIAGSFFPSSWTFLGSNDGISWTTLDTQTNHVWPPSPGTVTNFTVANPQSFLYYQLNISASTDGGHPGVTSFQMFSAATSGSGSYGGYVSGYCCYGSGCLTTPPPTQLQDPNPLPSIESGVTPPTNFSSTKQFCATCPDGSTNFSGNLIPVMTSNTAPSGVASASSEQLPNNQAWRAFAVTSTPWSATTSAVPQWLQYQLPTAKTATTYSVGGNASFDAPIDFQLLGSNDGSTWTTLDSQTGQVINTSGGVSTYPISSPQSFLYYRLNITKTSTAVPGTPTVVQIFQLSAVAPAQVCSSATATSTISQSDADAKATAAATTQAQAQLNCVPSFTATESYTANCPVGQLGQSVTNTVTYTSFISLLDAQTQALAQAMAAANAALVCGGSNNGQPITIIDNSPASPYPSVQVVSGKTGLVTKVTVNVTGFSHQSPSDVQMVLRSPSGRTCLLMWNVGTSGHNVTNLNFVFDDAAGSNLPSSGTIVGGTFKPTEYGSVPNMPAPLPNPPYASALSTFIGDTPNGSWSLWVADQVALDSGMISGGFTVNVLSS